jgi:hypothetical protein
MRNCHNINITEILLKVALNTITLTLTPYMRKYSTVDVTKKQNATTPKCIYRYIMYKPSLEQKGSIYIYIPIT